MLKSLPSPKPHPHLHILTQTCKVGGFHASEPPRRCNPKHHAFRKNAMGNTILRLHQNTFPHHKTLNQASLDFRTTRASRIRNHPLATSRKHSQFQQRNRNPNLRNTNPTWNLRNNPHETTRLHES